MNNKMVCPTCEISFTIDDVKEYEAHKAVYLLYQHGMSLRAISRLFKWVSPENARSRLEVYKRRLGMEEK